MNIYVTRHGQTKYNIGRFMQGHFDEPLNDTGRAQAAAAAAKVADIHFDAVYASPLDRAQETASIVGHVDRQELIIDPRIIEVDFGKYELKNYYTLGFPMWAYWALPEVFPAPATVEGLKSMVERTSSFLQELESKDYENVLVVCHGGIIRAICGYLEDRKNGIKWRPRPKNCEIRVYESIGGKHRFIKSILNDEAK